MFAASTAAAGDPGNPSGPGNPTGGGAPQQTRKCNRCTRVLPISEFVNLSGITHTGPLIHVCFKYPGSLILSEFRPFELTRNNGTHYPKAVRRRETRC